MPRNIPSPILMLTLPFMLFACATPQQSCISRNTQEYRTLNALLAETEGNLARGYAWEERQVVEPRYRQCETVRYTQDGEAVVIPYGCWRNEVYTKRYQVAIDPESETRKRDGLKKRQAALEDHTRSAIAACRKAYPDKQ